MISLVVFSLVLLLTIALASIAYQSAKAALWQALQPSSDVHGSAHLMTRRERRQSGLWHEGAGIVVGRWGRQILRDAGEGHLLCCGPSRSGKGVSVVNPTLFEWPHDVMALDPKGELADLCAGWRTHCGAQVYTVDPLGTGAHDAVNLLASIRMETPFAFTDTSLLAESLLPDPGPQFAGPHYYATGGQRVLRAVFLFALERDPAATVGDCLRFLTSASPLNQRLSQLMSSRQDAVRSLAQELLPQLRDSGPKLWATAVSALDLWRNPLVDERTRTNSLDLSSFQVAPQPITMYLRSPEGMVGHLAPLMRSIIQIVISRRMEGLPDRSLRPCLFLLDEFGSMGTCGPLVAAMPRMAGYQLRIAIIVQDLTDILRNYGPQQSILANCSSQVYLGANELNTMRTISALMGQETRLHVVSRDGTAEGMSTHGLSGSTTHSEGLMESPRWLALPDEVRRLDPEKLIILMAGRSPLIASKIAWDAPEYLYRRQWKGESTDAERTKNVCDTGGIERHGL